MSERTSEDRRVQKTQKLLREALASLVRERSYDSIAVKEILDRANVGRSTFYTHFRDKDELLASVILDMLRSNSASRPRSSAKGYERVLWFSLPIFEYLDQHRHSGEPGMDHGGRTVLHRHLQRLLGELIAEDIRDLQGRRKTVSRIPPDLFARHVAAAFVLVLNWWVESRSRLPPRDVNELFRELIVPTLVSTLG